MGFCQHIDLCFHASSLYLVCILFGMPSLHPFNVFYLLVSILFLVLVSVTAIDLTLTVFFQVYE